MSSIQRNRQYLEMDQLLLDHDTHHNALTLLGANALEKGCPKTAFLLADRRCRVRPLAGPEHFVLRAEAAHRLGHHTSPSNPSVPRSRSHLNIDKQIDECLLGEQTTRGFLLRKRYCITPVTRTFCLRRCRYWPDARNRSMCR